MNIHWWRILSVMWELWKVRGFVMMWPIEESFYYFKTVIAILTWMTYLNSLLIMVDQFLLPARYHPLLIQPIHNILLQISVHFRHLSLITCINILWFFLLLFFNLLRIPTTPYNLLHLLTSPILLFPQFPVKFWLILNRQQERYFCHLKSSKLLTIKFYCPKILFPVLTTNIFDSTLFITSPFCYLWHCCTIQSNLIVFQYWSSNIVQKPKIILSLMWTQMWIIDGRGLFVQIGDLNNINVKIT